MCSQKYMHKDIYHDIMFKPKCGEQGGEGTVWIMGQLNNSIAVLKKNKWWPNLAQVKPHSRFTDAGMSLEGHTRKWQ